MSEFESNGPDEEPQAESPEAGYPAGETEPLGDDVPSAAHPEDIADTPSDEEGEEEVTESPGGGPADPESGSV